MIMERPIPANNRPAHDQYPTLQEIRGVFRVCKDPLKKEQFSPLRQYLYSFASGDLSHRQLVALCEVGSMR